jgi:hypothetical protein
VVVLASTKVVQKSLERRAPCPKCRLVVLVNTVEKLLALVMVKVVVLAACPVLS